MVAYLDFENIHTCEFPVRLGFGRENAEHPLAGKLQFCHHLWCQTGRMSPLFLKRTGTFMKEKGRHQCAHKINDNLSDVEKSSPPLFLGMC